MYTTIKSVGVDLSNAKVEVKIRTNNNSKSIYFHITENDTGHSLYLEQAEVDLLYSVGNLLGRLVEKGET